MALISKDKRNWASTHRTSFDEKDLVLGTVVMFGDKTYGMYVPEENFDLTYGEFGDEERDIFLCYVTFNDSVTIMELKDYENDLKYIDNNYEYDIVRVYHDVFPENDITEDFVKNFKSEIQEYVKGRKYIKR